MLLDERKVKIEFVGKEDLVAAEMNKKYEKCKKIGYGSFG